MFLLFVGVGFSCGGVALYMLCCRSVLVLALYMQICGGVALYMQICVGVGSVHADLCRCWLYTGRLFRLLGLMDEHSWHCAVVPGCQLAQCVG